MCMWQRPPSRAGAGFLASMQEQMPRHRTACAWTLELTGWNCDVAALAQGKEKKQADSSPAH
eukprot:10022843-Alexandrium_andersonii.AAC.1